MKLKEKISHFWNVTLGVDCPDEVDILDSNNLENAELIESMKRVNNLESKYKVSNSAKGGKGSNSSRDNKIVEKVKVDSTTANKIAEEKITSEKVAEDRER